MSISGDKWRELDLKLPIHMSREPAGDVGRYAMHSKCLIGIVRRR